MNKISISKSKNNNLPFYKEWWTHYAFRAFALAFLCGFAIFIPFMIYDRGLFLYYGDFNVQQVPFYQVVHDSIRSGNFMWNWYTDLGVNTMGSYTFYNLTSPFFWATILFPSSWLPYCMGPLLMFKMAFASLTSYLFLKRYVKNPNMAVIGGLLYAFSGASVYNIFFNHFHEAYVFFPLLLAGLDKAIYEKKRGVFALAVFACCFVNYYFFVGMVVFTLIIFFIRILCGSYKVDLKLLGILFFEAVIGVLMTCVVLLPTILAVMQNNRVESPTYGWGALLYGDEQRYMHILQSLFFPPDIPARPNFTPNSNAKWASLGAWLPLFSMTGVISYLHLQRKSWIKKILFLCVIAMFIPILNNSFQLFNSAYYARWYYMFVLIAVLATIKGFEDKEVDYMRGLRWTATITIAMSLGIGLMPKSLDDNGNFKDFGLEEYPFRFWTYVAIAVISLLAVYMLIPLMRKNSKKFVRQATTYIMIISTVYSIYIIAMGKTQSYDTHNFIIPNLINAQDKITLPDDEDTEEFYRTDFYETMDNAPMFLKLPSIQAFHSIVPGSVMDFYPSIGVDRGVGSRPETSHYGLRGLTSVKYLFDYTEDSKSFKDSAISENLMPGFSFYETQNNFDIWINDAYIPMGFTYDQYITQDQFDKCTKTSREVLMLDAILLNDEQIEKYSDILTKYDKANMNYSKDDYLQLCSERKQVTCTNFIESGSGFTADIDMPKDNLVFFSVPYESGWTAYVDGKQVDVEKVNVGFMAIKVESGEHKIEFKYFTPGLKVGIIVTVVSVLIFAGYLYLAKRKK